MTAVGCIPGAGGTGTKKISRARANARYGSVGAQARHRHRGNVLAKNNCGGAGIGNVADVLAVGNECEIPCAGFINARNAKNLHILSDQTASDSLGNLGKLHGNRTGSLKVNMLAASAHAHPVASSGAKAAWQD